MMYAKRMLGVILVVLIVVCLPLNVSAKMENSNYVSIDGGAVDSITTNEITVEALYKPYTKANDSDRTYSCAAFVSRYYSEVYGRTVNNLKSTDSVPAIDQGFFYETTTPAVGDILRDNNSVHWALVKEVHDDGTIVVIQQNAWNDEHTKAMVGATVQVGDPDYSFFTWSEKTVLSEENVCIFHNFSFKYSKLDIRPTNAILYAEVSNPEKLTVTTVGCRIWKEDGTLLCDYTEECNRSESVFNMWYDTDSELGLTLASKTTYRYQFYLIYGGATYSGSVESFTTTSPGVCFFRIKA